MKDKIASLLRHGITMAGGILVHKGITDSGAVDAAAAGLAQVGAGFVMWAIAQSLSFANVARFAKLKEYLPKL